MHHEVYLLLGTNLGDRDVNLQNVRSALQRVGKIVKESSVYESAAWGKEDQQSFLNQVCLVNTQLSPELVLGTILHIEKEMGRHRLEKWGTRIIDIDVLFYDDLVVDAPSIKIPHPEIPNRRFTLEPLNEIAAEFVHPKLKVKVSELLAACPDPLWVRKWHQPL